jgi:hypothetical protein
MSDPIQGAGTDAGLSPLRAWLCDKIDHVFPSNDSELSYTDARYIDWTGIGRTWWEDTWQIEEFRIKNGENPQVVGCTTSCKDLLIKIVNLIREKGQISGSNTFAPLVFNLPAAGKPMGAWHYIGEAGNGDDSMPDGILMPRPGDFFQGQSKQALAGMHVGIIREFNFSTWTTLEAGQGGRWTDKIKRKGPRAFAPRACLGWLDIDKFFPGWTLRKT